MAVAMAISSVQSQIPVIQNGDANLVQTQINTNKVLRSFYNQILSLQENISEISIIGEIKFANVSITQFQMVAGTEWILANGQSCVGTDYANLTKNNNVPNISVTGTTAFIRVNL
jgi:ABC-type long-subunit fatty acid transport system fused permease/ATPase subunit